MRTYLPKNQQYQTQAVAKDGIQTYRMDASTLREADLESHDSLLRHFFQKVWRGEVTRAPVFALICLGVALSVSLHFLINRGFVGAGLMSQFGIAYGILNLLPLTVIVVTIIVFMRLARNFAQERASLAPHEHALGS